MKKLLLAALLLSGLGAQAQKVSRTNALRRPGETEILSFRTASGKVAVLCEGPKRAYLVYRFGTAAKVELQYPAVLAANSWKKFTYSSYHRMANPVAERYRLSFKNGGTEYELFDMMDAVTTKDGDEVYPHEVGVVITLPKGKIITIKGKPSSVQGSLELLDEQRARVQMGE